MTQVAMILRSRSQVKVKCPKNGQNLLNGPYLGCYFTYILGTKVLPINAHLMTQVPMTLTKGQGQNLPKIGLIINNWPKVKVISPWVIECTLLGCTLVPRMKSVGEIASKYDQFFGFLPIFMKI